MSGMFGNGRSVANFFPTTSSPSSTARPVPHCHSLSWNPRRSSSSSKRRWVSTFEQRSHRWVALAYTTGRSDSAISPRTFIPAVNHDWFAGTSSRIASPAPAAA